MDTNFVVIQFSFSFFQSRIFQNQSLLRPKILVDLTFFVPNLTVDFYFLLLIFLGQINFGLKIFFFVAPNFYLNSNIFFKMLFLVQKFFDRNLFLIKKFLFDQKHFLHLIYKFLTNFFSSIKSFKTQNFSCPNKNSRPKIYLNLNLELGLFLLLLLFLFLSAGISNCSLDTSGGFVEFFRGSVVVGGKHKYVHVNLNQGCG